MDEYCKEMSGEKASIYGLAAHVINSPVNTKKEMDAAGTKRRPVTRSGC